MQQGGVGRARSLLLSFSHFPSLHACTMMMMMMMMMKILPCLLVCRSILLKTLLARKFSTSSPTQRLAGKVAIVTGAAGGIGQATSRLFVEEGAMVVMADLNHDAIQLCTNDLDKDHILVHACDVSKENDVVALVSAALDRWGHLDIMMNNVGIGGSHAGVLSATTEDLKELWAVNVGGALVGMREAGRYMQKARRGGCIINTSSIAALQGGLGPPLYSTTKAALIALSRSAAYELAPFGVRVNTISPAATPNTRWLQMLRAQGFAGTSVHDISHHLHLQNYFKGPPLTSLMVAHSALFLADDVASAHITGHNLVLDGGITSFNHYDTFAFMKNM